jgi:hypothetical protein
MPYRKPLPYAVLFRSTDPREERVDSRHRTKAAALRAAARAQRALRRHNPGGRLLCGYVACDVHEGYAEPL